MADTGHGLTWRQRQILECIREVVQRRGYPPTLKEIGEAVGLQSTDSVAFQLDFLQRAGYLTRVFHTHRTISLTHSNVPQVEHIFGYSPEHLAQATVFIPSLGAAGEDTTDYEGREVVGVVPWPRQVVGEGILFTIVMADNSMQDASIVKGAQVVVRRQPHVWDGLVAADIGGEIVVRMLDGDWLVPRHPNYMPRQLDEEARVLGPVVAVMHQVPLRLVAVVPSKKLRPAG